MGSNKNEMKALQDFLKERKKQWETSYLCSALQNMSTISTCEGSSCKMQIYTAKPNALCKIPSMRVSSEKINKMWDLKGAIHWIFNGFCRLIVTFITWSQSRFLGKLRFIGFRWQTGFGADMHLQTSLAICAQICFMEIGPWDSGTGWSESFKGREEHTLLVHGTGTASHRQMGMLGLIGG